MRRVRLPDDDSLPVAVRSGAATVDMVLVMGATAALAGAALYHLGRLLRAAYEFTSAMISWPFL